MTRRALGLLATLTLATIASWSSGSSVRRSITSTDTPSFARTSAASSAFQTIAEYVTMVRSFPSRATRAFPIGVTMSSPSGRSSLIRR